MPSSPIQSAVSFIPFTLLLFTYSVSAEPWFDPISDGNYIWIEPGCFTKGSPNWEAGRYPHLEQQHSTCIKSGFWIGQHEVSQRQWVTVMGENPSAFTDCGPHCPVESVSWHDVQEYITRLNTLQKQYHYTLPSDSEWEYVARAGTQSAYFFADEPVKLDSYAWYNSNANGATSKVGIKDKNPWGLQDIYGNVWEWVCEPKPQDPDCKLNSNRPQALRGGSWANSADKLRSAFKIRRWPNQRYRDQGLRLKINK